MNSKLLNPLIVATLCLFCRGLSAQGRTGAASTLATPSGTVAPSADAARASAATQPSETAVTTTPPGDAAKTSAVSPNENTAAQTEYGDKDVVDLEQQFAALVAQKKDGTHELYRYPDGYRVLVTIRGGAPAGLSLMNNAGQPAPLFQRRQNTGLSRKRCRFVSANHAFTIGCYPRPGEMNKH